MTRDPFAGRSSGHRGRLLQWEGHELVELESDQLRVTISLTRGAEILELRHKKTDCELLWHGHEDIRRNRAAPSSEYGSGGWIDSFAGGWQTVLPTAQFPTDINGASFGLHGEAALVPWNLISTWESDGEVGVHLRVELRRVPLEVSRRVTVRGAMVMVNDEVTNLSATGIPVQFGHHIVFGEAIAHPGATVVLDPRVPVVVPGGEGRYGDLQSGNYEWPTVRSNDGDELDLSRPSDHEGLTGAGAIGPFLDGKVMITRAQRDLSILMAWDIETLPFAWIWFSNLGCRDWPLWGRARLLGFEPFNSRVEALDDARANGRAWHLSGGESMSVGISLTVAEMSATRARLREDVG